MSLKPIEERLEERFRRYSAITTQSNQRNLGKCIPSTAGQQVLAELLAKELQAMDLQDIICDNYATVTAVKPGNVPGAPRIGFICHLDTFDSGLCPDVKAQRIHYTGGDVCLNKGKDIWMRLKAHPELRKYVGQDILFSDGTSVLGADDKAAISSVMEMVAQLDSSQEKHGDIVICFVPDEEIGLVGAKHLNVKARFNVDFAYTLDCCELGEVVYECFNAASATIKFTGVPAHPMSAKGVMVNPLLMAMDFMNKFNREETPECTELREGYWWFSKMEANPAEARLEAMVREHDLAKYAARKAFMLDAAKEVQVKYPTGKVEIVIEDVYANISNSLKDDRTAIDLLLEAMETAGVKPNIIPMRGGTDGAALSAQGLLTPNFFTGAHNFHSRFEFLPIPAFVKSWEVCRNIVLLGADKRRKTPSSL
ncbi:Peptidase family M28/Peptidase family M20/M25/M40/M42 glutamyl aminopeptidase/Peptidase dimerisation domain containing protein, putative [Leishmania lindenbergi]|uniref:Peptidase family M28/Peptidase family M20/M25/M40/M42 glutamyl aminopeptidase n=1 Tax=Leishmania lindenbergi TaxID=651832 RepID=A0AAW3AKK1_9TRYP